MTPIVATTNAVTTHFADFMVDLLAIRASCKSTPA
jgi:hypothetical protein